VFVGYYFVYYFKKIFIAYELFFFCVAEGSKLHPGLFQMGFLLFFEHTKCFFAILKSGWSYELLVLNMLVWQGA
jgi:hypothetical protein